jgi:hypothetical protein
MNTGPPLDPNAAIVLGIASTAMPFARSPEDQAERWLRVLRLHGEAGITLSALGVSEARLQAPDEQPHSEHARPMNGDGADAVARVSDEASRIARSREADRVGTADVLVAVMSVYDADFDRVLEARGTDRSEVLDRLGIALPAREDA